jgi:hypothetical protein
MASFSVRVVNGEQKPVSGVRVVLIFTDPLRGATREEYTDSNGFAYFDNYDEGEVEVFIRGASYGKYYYEDGESITITL